MIDALTVNRFVALTPFQEPLTYYARFFDSNGLATDSYTSYSIPQSRSRDVEHLDFPADQLSLFAEMLNSTERVFELWKPVLDAVQMSKPSKDDYVVDACGQGWAIIHIVEEFHNNIFTLLTRQRK